MGSPNKLAWVTRPKCAFRDKFRPSWPEASKGQAKPPWDDSMSDGCTLVPDIPETMHCCLAHDRAYYQAEGPFFFGRWKADVAFFLCMLEHGWTWRALVRYTGVRLFGWIAWYT